MSAAGMPCPSETIRPAGIDEYRLGKIAARIRANAFHALGRGFLHECRQAIQQLRSVGSRPGRGLGDVEVGIAAAVVVFLAAVLAWQQSFAVLV